ANFLNAFIFGNVFIAVCAVIMVIYTTYSFHLNIDFHFLYFVFFATLTSYSFHWYLTPDVQSTSERYIWVNNNKPLLLLLFIVGITGSLIFIYALRDHILLLLVVAFITFFYSANKIPLRPFQLLKKIILGKTIYLAMAWTLVTVVLPLAMNRMSPDQENILFSLNRFFLIYPICILFDYRDREEDWKQNIRNIVGVLSIKSIRIFYYSCLIIFFFTGILLLKDYYSVIQFCILVFPGILLLFSYNYSILTKSDYWYYFYLDGLMMLSGVLFLIFCLLKFYP
ncbi:MAG: hypothetical protein ABI792_01190, partial [bacterium]